MPGPVDRQVHGGRGFVREEMHGRAQDEGRHDRVDERKRDVVVEVLLPGVRRPHDEAEDRGAAGPDLHYGPDLLLLQVVGLKERDDGRPLREKRERSMLELPRTVALRMQVSDLLELERRLEGGRMVRATTEEEEALGLLELLGEATEGVALLEHEVERVRNLLEEVRRLA